MFVKNFSDEDMKWFVCIENFAPIGMAALDKNNEIRCLLVDSSERRKGIASKLIEEIEKYAAEKGIKRLTSTTLISNVPTQNLFKKLGYKELFKYEKNF